MTLQELFTKLYPNKVQSCKTGNCAVAAKNENPKKSKEENE